MQPRKLIIFLIFFATVVYGFYFHFLSDQGGQGSRDGESDRESVMTPKSDRSDRPGTLLPATTQNRTEVPDWKRDPFRKTARINHTGARKNPLRVALPDKPKVSAISRTGGQPVVIADGRMLRIGEKTGSWRLIDVGDEAALFDGPGGRTWIRLGGSR